MLDGHTTTTNPLPELRGLVSPVKILLVEDNPGDAHLIREMLVQDETSRFDIDWVPKLSDGLERLSKAEIDLVLLDLGLPDSQGLETFLKAYAHAAELPFVVITASDDETLALAAVRHGAQEYLVKEKTSASALLRAIRYATERKRAEEVLRERAKKYRTLFDKLNVSMAIAELQYDDQGNPNDWRILDVNPASLHAAKRSRDDIVGKRLSEIYGVNNPEPFLSRFAHVVQTGEPVQFEGYFEPLRMHMLISAFHLAGSRFATLITDITERQQAEEIIKEREEHLSTVYENAPLIMMLVDSDRRVCKVNKMAEHFAGAPAAALIGRRGGEALRCLHALDDPQGCGFGPYCQHCTVRLTINDTFETGRNHQQLEASLQFSIKGEVQEVIFLLCTTRISVRGQPQVLVTIQEITDRKRAEEALRNSNAELENFAYMASHDLQEPLRMVTSYVKLIKQRYRNRLDADADDFIGYAEDGIIGMQKMINDLLALSRVSTHGKPFQLVDCSVVMNRVLRNLNEASNENGAVISHDPLPAVRADSSQMVQIFQNLIHNAIKFRGEKTPKIHVGAEKQADQWLFSVRDNGIGIPPDSHELIFQVFQHLHTASEYPGSGIGLAICKKIVERHGGRIWVESEPGEGSTFYFTIPDQILGS